MRVICLDTSEDVRVLGDPSYAAAHRECEALAELTRDAIRANSIPRWIDIVVALCPE